MERKTISYLTKCLTYLGFVRNGDDEYFVEDGDEIVHVRPLMRKGDTELSVFFYWQRKEDGKINGHNIGGISLDLNEEDIIAIDQIIDKLMQSKVVARVCKIRNLTSDKFVDGNIADHSCRYCSSTKTKDKETDRLKNKK